MRSRTVLSLALAAAALGTAGSPVAQEGLRLPAGAYEMHAPWGLPRVNPGIDPAYAPAWLAPQPYRYSYPGPHWKEAIAFAPSRSLQWSYSFGASGSLGLAWWNGPEASYAPWGLEGSHFRLFGRYSFGPDWAVSAEAGGRDAAGGFRLNDFRIGLRHRF
jgi:hypothetical protein